jgi:2,6-dihydroxypyridine 3-monooxygenase
MTRMPTVAVVGGSLGGLTAALLLRDAGCEVTVYERSSAALDARGAGIAVLEQTLRYPVERQGIPPDDITSRTGWIRFLEADATVGHEQRHRYRFSAWNTMYRTLLSGLDRERYLLGREMTRFVSDGEGVSLTFSDGTEARADLLVCADGISSTARHALLPEVTPRYAGYVGWRGVVPEEDLSGSTYEALHDALTYQLLQGSHVLVYPIPGLDGAVEPGRRLMNMVWYRNVPEDELPGFLTDREGRQRTVSLPPGAVGDDAVREMREFASQRLAQPLAEVATSIAEPFVQAVFDIDVPRMVSGRACLVGDAAFAVRPHAAAGTAKACADGWVLAEELLKSGGDVPKALAAWEARQLDLGAALLARTREIGDSSQFTGGFHPGDPRLIFGLYGPGR